MYRFIFCAFLFCLSLETIIPSCRGKDNPSNPSNIVQESDSVDLPHVLTKQDFEKLPVGAEYYFFVDALGSSVDGTWGIGINYKLRGRAYEAKGTSTRQRPMMPFRKLNLFKSK
jgi:hypothetical protein